MSVKTDWQLTLVEQNSCIKDVITQLNTSSQQIVLVVADDNRLLGTITDGDIRRAFIEGKSLTDSVSEVMNRQPIVASETMNENAILNLMQDNLISQIPIINENGYVTGLETMQHLVAKHHEDTCVFIMAGGFGKRLAPLTDDCPKPMLKIAGVPLLERIVKQVSSFGLKKIWISVHYLAEQVVDYFSDGSKWGVEINYVCEESPLGTAGALSLLGQEDIPKNIIVINGDVLTSIDLRHMLTYHQSGKANATMAVRKYTHTIPYGVVSIQGDELITIHEKPENHCFVNAGIYVFDRDAILKLKKNTRIDMPNLMTNLVEQGKKVKTFPIHEDWLDVGRNEDFQTAQQQYEEVTC